MERFPRDTSQMRGEQKGWFLLGLLLTEMHTAFSYKRHIIEPGT